MGAPRPGLGAIGLPARIPGRPRSGYRTGYELAVREWKITAAGMTHLGGPTYAELDRRRYPPGGRLSWIIPRPGEADGGQRS